MVDSKSGRAIKLRNNILNKLVDEIKQSSLFNLKFDRALKKCLDTIAGGTIQQITCYGLGNMHGGIDLPSRYQLALLILIHQELCNSDLLANTTIEVYDPSFGDDDIETLNAFEVPKFKVLTENEHCCRKLNQCSNYHLFYMPHVDYHLYNNLLGVNWNPEDLGKLIILGNSFTEMIDIAHRHGRSEDLCYLYALVYNCNPKSHERKSEKRRKRIIKEKEEVKDIEDGVLIEYQVSTEYEALESAFSRLSFHILSRNWLADKKNHTSMIKSNPKGWLPSIVVETNNSSIVT